MVMGRAEARTYAQLAKLNPLPVVLVPLIAVEELDKSGPECWYAAQRKEGNKGEEFHATKPFTGGGLRRRFGCRRRRWRAGQQRQDRLHPADDGPAAVDRQTGSRGHQALYGAARRHRRRQENRAHPQGRW